MIGVGHDGRGPDVLAEDAVVVVVDAHAPLGSHDAALGFEHLGIEQEALHAVGLHDHHGLQGGGREPVGVAGHVVAGEGVVGPAGELHAAVEFAGADLGRAVEHHVLDEMGHPGDAGPLVPRADAEERIKGDVGDAVVFEKQDFQAVVQIVDLDVLLAERGCAGRGQDGQGQDEQGELSFHAGSS